MPKRNFQGCNKGSFKAPGEDGFKALFYQSQLNVVGFFLCILIKGLFKNSVGIKPLNKTLVTLIPKVEEVNLFSQLRPISLSNVFYKDFTKVLASRLRTVMEKLVSRTQCNFVPQRQSRDNIIIAQEVIHSMRNKKKRRKGWMTINIDLEKAYDRLAGILLLIPWRILDFHIPLLMQFFLLHLNFFYSCFMEG